MQVKDQCFGSLALYLRFGSYEVNILLRTSGGGGVGTIFVDQQTHDSDSDSELRIHLFDKLKRYIIHEKDKLLSGDCH